MKERGSILVQPKEKILPLVSPFLVTPDELENKIISNDQNEINIFENDMLFEWGDYI